MGFLPERTDVELNTLISKKFYPGQWKLLIPLSGEGISGHGKTLFFRAVAEFSDSRDSKILLQEDYKRKQQKNLQKQDIKMAVKDGKDLISSNNNSNSKKKRQQQQRYGRKFEF